MNRPIAIAIDGPPPRERVPLPAGLPPNSDFYTSIPARFTAPSVTVPVCGVSIPGMPPGWKSCCPTSILL